jgi:putative membrane protein insertion efficiency factor
MNRLLQLFCHFIAKILLGVIKIYQIAISPFLGSNCRFYPTCSSYTKEAIEVHGPFKGGFLGLKRISKCHPYHDGGVDLVPDGLESKQEKEENRH